MDIRDATRFLRLIGAENIVQDEARGWVRASCPLAPWLHEGGRDRKPSFGIKLSDASTDAPYYHCFTCNSSGPLPRLLSNLVQLSGDRMLEASNFLSKFELFPNKDDTEEAPRGRRIRFRDRFVGKDLSARQVKQNLPVPQDILQQYPLLSEKCDLNAHAEVLRWLAYERNITLQSIAKFQLRLMVTPLDDVCVIFPIIAKDGETVLDIWARRIDDKQFFRVTPAMAGTTIEYGAPNLLFGNHVFDPSRAVVVVEGALDALRLYSIGIKNVVASFGGLSREQLDALYAPVVYLGFDNDDAGRKFAKKAAEKLNVPSIALLDWGVGGIKDAAELRNLEHFKEIFEARVKILKSDKTKSRKLDTEPRPKKHFLKRDGSFL